MSKRKNTRTHLLEQNRAACRNPSMYLTENLDEVTCLLCKNHYKRTHAPVTSDADEAVLAALRASPEPVGIAVLRNKTGLPYNHVRQAVGRLSRAKRAVCKPNTRGTLGWAATELRM